MATILSCPNEIIFSIMKYLKTKDLLNLLQSNISMYNLSQDEYWWKIKLHHDFSIISKPISYTWKYFYLQISTHLKPIDIYINTTHKLNSLNTFLYTYRDLITKFLRPNVNIIIIFTDQLYNPLNIVLLPAEMTIDISEYLYPSQSINLLKSVTNVYIMTVEKDFYEYSINIANSLKDWNTPQIYINLFTQNVKDLIYNINFRHLLSPF